MCLQFLRLEIEFTRNDSDAFSINFVYTIIIFESIFVSCMGCIPITRKYLRFRIEQWEINSKVELVKMKPRTFVEYLVHSKGYLFLICGLIVDCLWSKCFFLNQNQIFIFQHYVGQAIVRQYEMSKHLKIEIFTEYRDISRPSKLIKPQR